jgi:adenylate cyclase
MAKIDFQNDKVVEVGDCKHTLLELSLEAGIPHVHACGGNARCSTCRVLVQHGMENLSPRNSAEQLLAARKGLGDNIRLACQTRARGDCRLRRLVIDDQDADAVIGASSEHATGREMKIAILFTDIKDFTPMTEKQLPHDVIHILNRYFRMLGEIVLRHDGYIDKYIGDGMMALFGLEDNDPTFACLDAVSAGLQMQAEHPALNEYMNRYFGINIGTRIGIHYGEAVVGQMGHPLKQQFTAIGDSVNAASRVESSCKGTGADLLISEDVYKLISTRVVKGIEVSKQLKGKEGEHRLVQVTGLVNGCASMWPMAKRVRRRLRSAISRRTGPLFVRLVYHDAITWDPNTGTGGMNGSIRFKEELDLPENKGLDKAIAALECVKKEFPEASWADIIAMSGAVAIQQAGGPDIGVPGGRRDAEKPDPAGRLPMPDEAWDPLRDRLMAMGFTMEELVALCGAHTMGSVKGVPYTETPFHFDNEYFKLLIRDEEAKKHMLGTDRAMAEDPVCRDLIEAFAMDQSLFFKHFSTSYRKLTLLGTGIKV